MFLQNYDPNSVKLYSKCARNQASKFSQKKRPMSSSRLYSSLIVYNQSRKNKKVVCTFDMSQSRQQREKKYEHTLTPAVGQYNPKIQKKIKLTWDILKIYKNKSHGRKHEINIGAFIKQSQQQNINELEDNHQGDQFMATQVIQGHSPQVIRPNNSYQTYQSIQKNSNKNQNSKSYSRRLKSQNSRYKTIKSQVDMSKMTGRQKIKYHSIENQNQLNQVSQDIDLNKSVQYIKSKPSLNFQFQRQISREKVNSLNKKIVIPSDYSYDFKVTKPNGPKIVSFGTTKGRQIKDPNQSYSYTHYDYDKYVWGAKSNVFNNTKKNVTDFKKQTKRVLFKR